MPKHRAARHRGEPRRAVRRSASRAARRAVVLSSAAATVTGVAVAGGVLAEGGAPIDATLVAANLPAAQADEATLDREPIVSRSTDRRTDATAKAAVLTTGEGHSVTRTQDISEADPKVIAAALLPEFGFADSEFGCLNALYISESDWRVDADNPTSSAYGIPQALTQLHDLPEGYMTSAEVQIRWGLGYIRDTYGTPCNAWTFKASHGWY